MTESIVPIFRPKSSPMRLAVFGSGRGTTLEALLASPHLSFEVVQIVSDRPCRIQEIACQNKIPMLFHPFEMFCKIGGLEPKDPTARVLFDQKLISLLDPSIDLILLAGYMRIVSSPLLRAFENRIVNTHPADLAALEANGRRKYTGADAVEKALRSKESRTRSSVILIDEDIDTGPVLLSGPSVQYQQKDSAKEHQEKQKLASDYPACAAAIRWIAEGRIALGPFKTVFFDGRPQPPCGVELREGENVCAGSLA